MHDPADAPTVLLADDEPLAREAVRLALEPLGVRVVAEVGDGPAAVRAVHEHQPDLLFLDIEMPGCGGFEVLRRLDQETSPEVVFVTAFDHHAVQAFEAAATDYVLKPFSDARLQNAARRALGRKAPAAARSRYPARFAIRSRRRIYFVATESIETVHASGNYVSLSAEGSTHLIRSPLSAFEHRLDPTTFARVHRSSIVNLDYVSEVRMLSSGDYLIAMKSGETVRMSRRYRDRVIR